MAGGEEEEGEEGLEGGRNVRKEGVEYANARQWTDGGGHLARLLVCVFHVSLLLYILLFLLLLLLFEDVVL